MNTSKGLSIVVLALVISVYVVSCSHNAVTAKPVSSASEYPAVIERAQKKHSYMYMRSGINQYTISSIDLDDAKQQMTVTLNKVDTVGLVTLSTQDNKPATPTNTGASAKRQIRMYMADSTSYTLDEPHTIPLTKIARLEVMH